MHISPRYYYTSTLLVVQPDAVSDYSSTLQGRCHARLRLKC